VNFAARSVLAPPDGPFPLDWPGRKALSARMNPVSRRDFLKASLALTSLAAVPLGAAPNDKLKIGVTDWNLHRAARPDSISLAKRIGFDGVQISLGRAPDRLPLSDPELQEKFLAAAKAENYPIAGACLDILHQNYLKSDPLGQRWVRQSIPITRKLGAKVILLPFFGNGALQTRAEMNYVADFLKDVAAEAQQAGVILGLENTNSAEDNARILDRAASKAVLVYYDVGNSTQFGYDIYKEIRWLGKDRIGEFHLKDNPHLMGEGKIDFPRVLEAIKEIGFSGWAQLETDSPSGSVENDMKKNLGFVRKIVG